VLTAGDHIWKKKEIFEIIAEEARILRPANFPSPCVGKGSGVFKTKSGAKVGIISILGRVFMEPMVECPFRTVKSEYDKILSETKVVIVDVHAEATSEKVALGWYLDGLASAIVGTHTHIQTADERILPRGSAYITDMGMTGPIDSVIGRKIDDVLERFITQMPTRFEIASENIQLQGVVLDINEESGKANSITRIQRKVTN
jgi:metallophosphoesterase (TIGR00282 family)